MYYYENIIYKKFIGNMFYVEYGWFIGEKFDYFEKVYIKNYNCYYYVFGLDLVRF